MLTRLTPMDERICATCSGAVFYYRETPGRHPPLYAELTKCDKPHVESVMVDGDRVVELFTQRPQED